jgi:dCTP deaminase
MSDIWIRQMSINNNMIDPFISKQMRYHNDEKIISYGLSSYGYDVRVARDFKIFTNVNSCVVDPKNFNSDSFVEKTTDVCIIPPNSFALAHTIEYFKNVLLWKKLDKISIEEAKTQKNFKQIENSANLYKHSGYI